MTDPRIILFGGYEFQLNQNGEAHILWKSGASHTMNADLLWAGFKTSTAFLNSAYRAEYALVDKAHRLYGSSGADVLSRSTGGGLAMTASMRLRLLAPRRSMPMPGAAMMWWSSIWPKSRPLIRIATMWRVTTQDHPPMARTVLTL